MHTKRLAVLLLALLPATGGARAAEEVAIFGAGCYWSSEAVFEHIIGVTDVVSGFAVPAVASDSAPHGSRHAGYAEVARVTFDPSRISYRQLLEVFFLAAHDPTQVDRQGPDVGPQYRSVVFATSESQRQAAAAYLDELTAAGQFPRPIATEITTARSFRAAPDQDFVKRNPDHPYVVEHDRPLLASVRRRFAALYRE